MKETLTTKVTRLKAGLYGCRVLRIEDMSIICEMRVKKSQIGDAFYSIFRTLDKLGYMSPMASASRDRQKGRCLVGVSFLWGK